MDKGRFHMRTQSSATAAELVRGMANRTGFDLSEPVNAMQFRTMVRACQGCSNPGECAKLQASSDPLDKPPSYCRNTDRLG